MEMQKSILPKFRISVFGKFGFEKIRNRDTKIENLKFCKEFGFAKMENASQNLQFDFELEFLGQEIDFENLKIINY